MSPDSTPSAQQLSSEVSNVCVIIGHGIEAITSAVVLASLGQVVHLHADQTLIKKNLQQYGFEHHLQALWQMYVQQQQIVSLPIAPSAEALIATYEVAVAHQGAEKIEATFYWLFLDSTQSIWSEDTWLAAFNHSHEQKLPIVISGSQTLGQASLLAQRLQRAWVYYVPFIFLQDGDAFSSMLTPSLWLLGEKTPNSSQHLPALQTLMQHARTYHCADIATIEFARSSIMAMLATRVSLMNEMSRLADSHQVDIQQVSHIMGLDERVGRSYLQAGWGFGGNTLPAELTQLEQAGCASRVEMPILKAVRYINEDQKELIFRKFWQYFDGFIDHKTVVIWGGSYKAGSGRTAGSAIHPLLHLLWSYNITTLVYSDKAQAELTALYHEQPLLQLIDSPYERLDSAQAIFIISWSAQEHLDTARLNQQAMPIFDAQNALTRAQVTTLIGDYIGIGRAKS
ncbi:UDP-glucose/GDP-mannose dehydrogenase family protein [Psychrobacter sp. 16-MNA-CIBAN-0192]|uniref:UDP-glucose/GDP-mannose dehydrogenase family protein n=1 Tax=Psychrobacter sp. 16-MNA-CIBAN-0192 TaxID=3140448 RepID=UPI00331AF9D1